MTSVEFVEKALIGSLLNDSTRRDEVPWLGAEDFTNPLCRAIWRHLESGDPPRCQPLTDLVEMSEMLGRNHELHVMLRSPAELATLQVQAPEKPAVVDYGRILVEATIRREISEMGLRLEPLATSQPVQIMDGVAHALASIESYDQRWQVSMGHRADLGRDHAILSTPSAAGTIPAGSEHIAIVEDRMDHDLAERAVIGAAVHDWPPGARAQVLGTVRECDFTQPQTTATWRAVEYLTEHDAAIDEVTVTWQALRDRSRAGEGLTIQELRETRDSALLHATGATTLARATLTRVASRATTATTQCSEDTGIDVATLIDSATTHQIAVAAAAQRLTGACSPNESLTAINKRLRAQVRPSLSTGIGRVKSQCPSA